MKDDGGKVVSLDRVRALREFEGDASVAYVELLWGERSFAVHAAIRDLEAIRMGTEPPDKPLREPETMHEAAVLVARVRWIGNFLARSWDLEELVRPEDWDGDERSG